MVFICCWVSCWRSDSSVYSIGKAEAIKYQDDERLSEKEKKIKEYVISYLKERDIVDKDGNVIYADKAFKVNSVLRWCIERKSKGRLSSSLAAKHFKMLDMFIEDKVDLVWIKGNVKTAKKEQ